MLANILAKVPDPRRRPRLRARPQHRDQRHARTSAAAVVVNVDLTDFFPTITFPRVRGIFQQLGYSPAVATMLALLCTESPRRTVDLRRQAVPRRHRPARAAAGRLHQPRALQPRRPPARLAPDRHRERSSAVRYTRYADDLTFSSAAEADKIGYLLARVRHIAQDEGFAVNEKKTRVQRRRARQTVTGIVVNDRPGVPRDDCPPPARHPAPRQNEGLAAQNRENHPHFEAWLRGMIAYVRMVNPCSGEPLAGSARHLRA